MAARKVSSLLHGRYILAVNPLPVRVLEHHSVVVDKGSIIDVCETKTAKSKYTSDNEESFDSHVIMPGLVNCHTHTPMTLLRGYADDVPLMTWLQEHIWPIEGKFAREVFCSDGTELACAELIRGGTTCFNDMYFFPKESALTAQKAGMRAVVGAPVLMFPTAWAGNPEEYMQKAKELLDEFKDDPLISVSICPHAPYTCTDEQLISIRDMAKEYECVVHMHVHETAGEVKDAKAKDGKSPLHRLDDLGLLNNKFIGVHMVHLTEEEIALCKERGVNVVHCPESNTKLASGGCPTHALNEAGVNVAIGTDGAASNNDLDMLGEMRTAALLGKFVANNAAALDAATILRMGTINGAKALGIDHICGSIEVGKRADLSALRLDSLECAPMYSVASHLVYTASRHSISDVWVDGKRVLKERSLLTLDQEAIVGRANGWATKIKTEQAEMKAAAAAETAAE